FGKSGKLLKTTEIKEVFKIGKRWYPKNMVFKDVLKKGNGTEFIIDSIEFDVEIPALIFTKAALRK
ncbi:MAG: outer membrane lipoprotein-sorting protein, partial [Candidatus Cloacimonetes bacterium]|nr:outer membrane lipoprotein-sorting protein [Candidatus Cloacimonadota bacterium]